MKTKNITIKGRIFLAVLVGLSIIGALTAGTLTEQQSQSYVQGNDGFTIPATTYSITVNGTNRYSANLVITNGGKTTISFPNVTLPGRVHGRDTSATGTVGNVKLSVDGTNYLVGVAAAEPYSFRMVTNQASIIATVDSNVTHTININVESQ